MTDSTCTISTCGRPLRARGLCATHYKRATEGNLPLDAPVRSPGRPIEDRFWSNVDTDGECWLWTTGTASTGYGVLHIGGRATGRMHYAHRLTYEWFIGPIPAGLTIDHVCHNADKSCPGGDTCVHRRCVNPAHLEAVTPAENVRRGRGGEWCSLKTHCPHGHPYTPDNTYVNPKGSRVCRTCKQARHAADALMNRR